MVLERTNGKVIKNIWPKSPSRELKKTFFLHLPEKKVPRIVLAKELVAKSPEKMEFAIEPERLGKLAGLKRVLPIERRLELMLTELKKEYPKGRFVENPKWFSTSINGQPIQYANLYASVNEFLTIVHVPFRSPTFTGRFKGMDIHSAVVRGSIKECGEGHLRTRKYGIGEVYRLKDGEVKNIEFEAGTIILDYYRGNTLSVVPYSVLLPAFFQTGDFAGLWEQLKDSFSLVFENIVDQVKKDAERKRHGKQTVNKRK